MYCASIGWFTESTICLDSEHLSPRYKRFMAHHFMCFRQSIDSDEGHKPKRVGLAVAGVFTFLTVRQSIAQHNKLLANFSLSVEMRYVLTLKEQILLLGLGTEPGTFKGMDRITSVLPSTD